MALRPPVQLASPRSTATLLAGLWLGLGFGLGACATADNTTPEPTFDAPLVDSAPDAAGDAASDAPADASNPDAAVDAPPPVDGGAGTSCVDAQDITAAAFAPGGTTISGDTTAGVNHVTTPDSCTGYGTDGEDDIYRITVVAGDRVAVTLTPTSSWDTSVQLLNACADVACLIGRDNGFAGGAETFVYNFTTAGTNYIVVDSYLPGVFGPYTLAVTLTHP